MQPIAKSRGGYRNLATAIHAKARFRCPGKGKFQMSAECQERSCIGFTEGNQSGASYQPVYYTETLLKLYLP